MFDKRKTSSPSVLANNNDNKRQDYYFLPSNEDLTRCPLSVCEGAHQKPLPPRMKSLQASAALCDPLNKTGVVTPTLQMRH